jgi:hypothetical protein
MGEEMTLNDFLKEIELSDYTTDELNIMREFFQELINEINEWL